MLNAGRTGVTSIQPIHTSIQAAIRLSIGPRADCHLGTHGAKSTQRSRSSGERPTMLTRQNSTCTDAHIHPQASPSPHDAQGPLHNREEEAAAHLPWSAHGCAPSEALIAMFSLPKYGWMTDLARRKPTEMPECEPHHNNSNTSIRDASELQLHS